MDPTAPFPPNAPPPKRARTEPPPAPGKTVPPPAASSSTGEPKLKPDPYASWSILKPRFELRQPLGQGSYGEVVEAIDHDNGDMRVAIKRVPNIFQHETDAKRLYREIRILRHLRGSPYVVSLLDIIHPPSYDEFRDLYLVFEHVDTDLYKLILSPQYLTVEHVRAFMLQLLMGLKYVHSAHVIHRDVKPANILLNEDCSLKLCDLGLARVNPDLAQTIPDDGQNTKRKVPAAPGNQAVRQMTKHVVTRWYRAPELILLHDYDAAVDIWSAGCIMAELLSMQKESVAHYVNRAPLFPGKTCFPLSTDPTPQTNENKLDQLHVIFDVIGTPSVQDMASLGAERFAKSLQPKQPRSFAAMYPGAPPPAIDILERMLKFNPRDRISVDECLEHEFIKARSPGAGPLPAAACADPLKMEEGETGRPLKQLIYNEVMLNYGKPRGESSAEAEATDELMMG